MAPEVVNDTVALLALVLQDTDSLIPRPYEYVFEKNDNRLLEFAAVPVDCRENSSTVPDIAHEPVPLEAFPAETDPETLMVVCSCVVICCSICKRTIETFCCISKGYTYTVPTALAPEVV